MSVKNVAIVSANPTFLRFFELECQLLCCTVQCFSKMPPAPKNYTHIFVDTDTVRHYSVEGGYVITVSQDASSKISACHLQWPVDLESLRLCLDGISSVKQDERVIGEDEKVLWIESRERREVRYGMRCTVLSPGEFLLFEALANAEKNPVRRETLMEILGAEKGNISDVYVCSSFSVTV